MANTFKYESFFKEVEKELLASERKYLRKAGNMVKREIKKSITSKDLVDEGNLLKGIKIDLYQHTVLIGAAAPGYHAAIVEYGTEERVGKDGHGSGRMPATPYMLPAFRLSTPKAKAILSEEW